MRKWIIVLIVALGTLLSVNLVAAQGGVEQQYTIQRGDTIAGIARAFGIDAEDILIRNNIIDPNRIRVGDVLVIPSAGTIFPQQHVVQPGERLSDIATRYNTTVDELIQINLLGNANVLFPGQVLQLPMTATQHPMPPTHPPAHDGVTDTPFVYRVEIGDNLFRIALRFGTTVDAIVAANGIPHPNYIQAGMLIVIPDANYVPEHPPVVPHPPGTTTYIVQHGDTLSEIAQQFGTTVHTILQFNHITNINHIFAGQVLFIPASAHPPYTPPHTGYHVVNGFYTVRPGDTLFRIANAFGVNIYDIARANSLLNLNHIFVGQHLVIPGYH